MILFFLTVQRRWIHGSVRFLFSSFVKTIGSKIELNFCQPYSLTTLWLCKRAKGEQCKMERSTTTTSQTKDGDQQFAVPPRMRVSMKLPGSMQKETKNRNKQRANHRQKGRENSQDQGNANRVQMNWQQEHRIPQGLCNTQRGHRGQLIINFDHFVHVPAWSPCSMDCRRGLVPLCLSGTT